MNLFWLLFSTQGKLDRRKFWISILLLNLSSVLITFIGDNVFTSYEPTRISFLAFFLSKMMPRFYSIFVLISSFFLAKKRVNDIGSNEWIPILYVIALFIPTFMSYRLIKFNIFLRTISIIYYFLFRIVTWQITSFKEKEN